MSTIFDNYTDPDIPGVFMSVTDNSFSEVQTESDRRIFMVMPLKYGDENVMKFSKTEDLEAAVGLENSFKYGMGQFYARNFIEAGATVYIKRIEDETATYANQILRRNEKYYALVSGSTPDYTYPAFDGKSFTEVTEKDTLIQINSTVDSLATQSDKSETVFSLLAKGRGAGYNELFSVFKSANDYEKFDANDEGIINYRFNFVNMDVMEYNTFTAEVKKKANTILFSLLDIDPTTKNTITHKSTGKVLWVNDIVVNSNFYMTAMVNKDFQDEIRRYPNIDAVLQEKNKPYFYVEGKSSASDTNIHRDPYSRTWYEVTINDRVTPQSYKIQRANFSGPFRQPPYLASATFEVDVAGTPTVYRMVIDDATSALTLDAEVYTPSYTPFVATYPIPTGTSASNIAYLDGEKAFYTLKLEYNTTTAEVEPIIAPFRFLRWELYSFLMEMNMKLSEGKDNTSTIGFVNSNGSANIDAIANAIFKYVRDDKEVREVIYPKYTFNYIIDWTETIKVKDIFAKLADRIRRSMHICNLISVRPTSTGLSADYSVENDILCREQSLTFSSYNTMLYSSQQNKTHFDPITKQTYRLPSAFYAMLNHLYVDQNISITEPAANIEKGIIRTTNLKLTHEIFSEDIEDLRKLQINCIVTDGSDNYFIDQLTAYKKSSKLSLGNVVKTLQYLQILIPKKLKKYVQKKETDIAVTSNVLNEVQEILKPYKASTNSEDAIFKDVVVNPSFSNNILTIAIRVTPAGTTEKINVPIIVQS